MEDGSIEHYRLENGKVLITQRIVVGYKQSKGKQRRLWEYSTIALTEKQLARLAKVYLRKSD